MRLIRESLASVAFLDDVLGVAHGRRPVEPGLQSFGHEVATASVVSTGSLMDVEEDSSSIGRGDASLEYSYDAAFIQFAVDNRECLGSLRDLPCISRIVR